jgi:magnesium transporter
LALIPAMAFFIPLITATGGNVGIQSSTVVVQSLANKSNFETGLTKRLGNLLLVGLLNGLVISLVVFLFNIALGDSLSLAIVVSISLLCVVMLSSIMGTITPIVLNKFGINPALASGPFITTANDLLGLGVYFIIAHSLLQI